MPAQNQSAKLLHHSWCVYLFFQFWALLFSSSYLSAQSNNFNFEIFTPQNNPIGQAQTITQDKDGFLWLGTFDGLVKYDGYEYTTYRKIPGDSTSLNETSIEKIYLDQSGDLWIGTSLGLNRYNSQCDCFQRFPDVSNDLNAQVNAFAEDANGNLWIGTQKGGLFKYNPTTQRFTRHLNQTSNPVHLLDDQIRILLVDKNNILWIGTGEPFDPSITGDGLVRYDLNTGYAKRYLNDPNNSNSLLDNRVSALYEDQQGKLWIGSCESGLHYWDSENDEIIRQMPTKENSPGIYAPDGSMGLWSSCPHVRFILQDTKGAFWIGTFNGGLNYFNPATGVFHQYAHHPTLSNGLVNNMVWDAFEDNQGRIWILNLEGGFYKIDPSLQKFDLIENDPKDPGSLPAGELLGIYETPSLEDLIWIGSRDAGLIGMNKQTKTFTQFRHDSKDKSSISSDIVWVVYEDRRDNIWVGTEAGLNQFDPINKQFKIIDLNTYAKTNTSVDAITTIYEDSNDNLWVGTWSEGLIKYDRDSKVAYRFHFDTSEIKTHYNSVYVIHEDSEKNLWIGIWQGDLYKYNHQKNQFESKIKGLGNIFLLEDKDSVFWITTENNGIIQFDPKTDVLKQYLVEDGLPSNRTFGVLQDDQDSLLDFH